MEPEERIKRMAEEGLISAEQAECLYDSLARNPKQVAGGEGRRSWSIVPWLAGGLAVLLIIALWASSGGEPQIVQDVTKTLNQPGEHGEMNKTFSTVLALGLLAIVPVVMWAWMHNSLVGREESVFEAWAQTESNFQRRADLVPALVETVARYMKHERETLSEVTGERAKAAEKMAQAVEELIRGQKEAGEILKSNGRGVIEDEQVMRQLFSAQSGLRTTIGQVLAVAESYPELKSGDQFLQLQAQLEGTENRINVSRMRFNEAVSEFNGTMRMLPWSLVASAGGFSRKAYFRSSEEAKDAPELKLDQ